MMENPEFCPMNELLIDRHAGFLPFVGLFGEEGTPLGQLPATWPDEAIKIVIQFANKAYSRGYDHGARDKAADLRSALGI